MRLLFPELAKRELQLHSKIPPIELINLPDIYAFVDNDPVNFNDALGLLLVAPPRSRMNCAANCGRAWLNDLGGCGKKATSIFCDVFSSCLAGCSKAPIEVQAECKLFCGQAATATAGAYDAGCSLAATGKYMGCYTHCMIFGY